MIPAETGLARPQSFETVQAQTDYIFCKEEQKGSPAVARCVRESVCQRPQLRIMNMNTVPKQFL